MSFSPSKEYQINPWVVMAVFAVLVGPFALSFHMHYPDEMYYTDAAVKMLQTGDYLTTYLGSGELRFKKPIGTYWAVIAGFKLFGVNAFGSRFFFLIAGALTVGLTYWLGKILFTDRKISGLSALIIAANPVLIFSATRSIPDVLLVLTMTASAIGFAGLIRYGNEVPKKFLWILYLSLGVAFEVKGLPAVALGGLGLVYLLANPWQRIQLKTLIHLPSLLVSLFIALFWFVAMYQIHGPTYLDSFLEDQVGTRVASRVLLIVQNGFLALAILIAIFIPWIFFALPKAKETLRKTWNENAAFFGFAILWGLAILAMGAMTSKFYERYLLPVAPVLAVWLGWFLVRADFEIRRNGLKIAAAIFLSLNLIILIFSFWLNLRLGSTPWIWGQISVGILILIYLGRLVMLDQKMAKAISYSMILLFFLASTATYQISLPDQGKQLKAFVLEQGIDPTEEIGFAGNLHVSSKIRIGLGTDFNMVDLPRQDWAEYVTKYPHLILEDKLLTLIDTAGYEVKVASINWDGRSIPDLLMTAGTTEFDSLLTQNGKKYYWLRRKLTQ
jgi:4-amino-4-deoxy-L-arabinose transferase-like glycosyltransferase